MYNTSANDLEMIANDLSTIARNYTNASQEMDQHVITLEGAVAHALSGGTTGWKGLSSEAFVGAWLERKARLQQASTIMSQSALYLTQMARTIEDNLSTIRADQSVMGTPIFHSLGVDDQASVMDEMSQAQNAILMAMNALNSQLEALAEEVSDCPEVDREAGDPYYDNINRNDAGGGGGKTPEQRIGDAVGDPVLAELLIELANQNGANLEDVAALLENGVGIDQMDQWLQEGVNLEGAGALINKGIDTNVVSQWIEGGVNLQDAAMLLDKGVSSDAIIGLSEQGVDLTNAGKYVDAMLNKGYTIDQINKGIETNIANADASRWRNIPSRTKGLISDAIDRWAKGRTQYPQDGTAFDNLPKVNNKGKLVTPVPPNRGPYTEYTVADGPDRGGMRIVVDRYGNVYFFEEHYNVNQGGAIPVSLRDIINAVR